jgi:hypothetical protein
MRKAVYALALLVISEMLLVMDTRTCLFIDATQVLLPMGDSG